MRVAIYIRVSTLDQAREGYSLAAQRAALERWAAERGYEGDKPLNFALMLLLLYCYSRGQKPA